MQQSNQKLIQQDIINLDITTTKQVSWNISKSKILYYFTIIFTILLPITSYLLIPEIQGTTPGILLALLSPLPSILLEGPTRNRYLLIILSFFLYLFLSIALSQLSILIDFHASADNLILIKGGTLSPIRKSILTQSLYLVSCWFTFAYFAVHYSPEWDGNILAGGIVLASIGIAEWVYFSFTGNNFSFLSNRVFGDTPGSLTETFAYMDHIFLRLKSLTGEPSMYSISVFPYFIFALSLKRNTVAKFLLISLLLTTSTTALLGLVTFYIIYILLCSNGIQNKLKHLSIFAFSITLLIYFFYDLLVRITINKFSMLNISGASRYENIYNNIDFWLKSGPAIKLFGIGWGTIRSTDLFSTLLVNTGLLGLLAWLVLFLTPAIKTPISQRKPYIISIGMVTLFIMLLIAVPEYNHLPTWVFLGILYNKLWFPSHSITIPVKTI